MIDILTRSAPRIVGMVKLERRERGERPSSNRLVFRKPNLITNDGKNMMRDAVLGRLFRPVAMAVGLDATVPDVTDTALGSEYFRKILTRRYEQDKKAVFQLIIQDDEGNGAGSDFVEVGLFNSTVALGGELLARLTHDGVPKTSSFIYTYTWEWEFV